MNLFRKVAAEFSGKGLMVACAALAAVATGPSAQAAPTYAYQQTIQIPGITAFSGYDLSNFDSLNELY